MTARAPWYIWTSLASVTCILIGVYWDISWHMSIGRDTFWTPAHLAIQLGAIVAGSAGAYLIVSTTVSKSAPLRDISISVWGFRGPLGAFVAVWGAAAMMISAPFDNWWHDAYGLDVKILSPPHAVLTLGMLAVSSGGVLLIVSTLNRATGAARRPLEIVMLVVGGQVLILSMISILEHTFRSNQHRADAYRAIALVAPLMLLLFSTVSRHRWGMTIVATTYTVFMASMVWLFALFPAEAKLGPVYQQITHYIPIEFPPLLIAPAIVCDLVLTRISTWRRLLRALVIGPVFVAVLIAVQWPFASFLMAHGANWFFGTHYHPYFMHPEWYSARNIFMPETGLAIGLVQAVVAAILTTYLGMFLGDAMRKAKR